MKPKIKREPVDPKLTEVEREIYTMYERWEAFERSWAIQMRELLVLKTQIQNRKETSNGTH